jgi:hypothetical membrane protein
VGDAHKLQSRHATSRVVDALALARIVFPFLFVALVIVQGLLQPEYSHVSMPISALAAFPYGRIQVANFLVAGTLLTLFAVAQHRGVRPTPRGVLGPAFQFVGGLGVVVAGLFSWRMVDGVPTRTPVHVVAAATAFAFTGLGIIVISRRLAEDPDWSPLAAFPVYSPPRWRQPASCLELRSGHGITEIRRATWHPDRVAESVEHTNRRVSEA